MRDRRTIGRFFLGAFDVEVNPLVVAGGFGKFLDVRLGDFVPLGSAEFLAYHIGDIIDIDFAWCHRRVPLLRCVERSVHCIN